MPEQKTVRVRIAVVVDSDGRWSAVGNDKWSDQESIDEALMSNCDDGSTFAFVEADIPIPEPQTIQGTVTQ